MSKVLIDRELLERAVYGLELAYETDTPIVRDICAVLAAPSGTPAMPVKAYYHEAPNEYGGLNKSVGLEVRKEFTDAPLVLESDAMARIACLEGEIAKRDEELAACRVAVENCELFRARIADLEHRCGMYGLELTNEVERRLQAERQLSAIKAQGVVMPEHETSTPSSKWASAGESDPHGKVYDCERAELSMGEYTDDELANAVFMHDHRSFDIAATMRGEPGSIVLLTAAKDRIRWLSRSLDKALARLNVAPVQQVSVPDGKVCVPVEVLRLYEFMAASFTPFTSQHEQIAISLRKAKAAMLAAPAAPAADAWIPVSERLPGEDDQVLCWCEDETVAWAEVSSHHNSFFTDMTHELLPVTHWMPLPAAPIKIEANRHE